MVRDAVPKWCADGTFRFRKHRAVCRIQINQKQKGAEHRTIHSVVKIMFACLYQTHLNILFIHIILKNIANLRSGKQ